MLRLALIGRVIFALAMLGLGVESLVCAHVSGPNLGFGYTAIPILPFLPPLPWLGYLFGVILAACAVGMLIPRTVRLASLAMGSLLFLCLLVLELPKYLPHAASISLRTVAAEVLALAALAWLLAPAAPEPLARVSRWLFALSLLVFGADHFPALVFIANLIPAWIPWHQFWVAFFGAALMAGGVAIAFRVLTWWAAVGTGLVFAIWVVTLHIPRVLGLYGIPGATHDPAEWSSLCNAIAMWGGCWGLAAGFRRKP